MNTKYVLMTRDDLIARCEKMEAGLLKIIGWTPPNMEPSGVIMQDWARAALPCSSPQRETAK